MQRFLIKHECATCVFCVSGTEEGIVGARFISEDSQPESGAEYSLFGRILTKLHNVISLIKHSHFRTTA